MVIRSTVKPHEKSPEESSEDRQSRGDSARTAANTVGDAHAIGAGGPSTGTALSSVEPRSASVLVSVPAPLPDAEDDVDGCDVEAELLTADEELPGATGGVA
jgi:hypothetical protein